MEQVNEKIILTLAEKITDVVNEIPLTPLQRILTFASLLGVEIESAPNVVLQEYVLLKVKSVMVRVYAHHHYRIKNLQST